MPFPSQLRQCINDTLLQRAEGDRFDALVAGYGFPRPFQLSRAAWRKACLAGVFGKAGTFGTLFDFIENALSDYQVELDVTLGGDSDPTRVFSSINAFLPGYAGMLIRIDGVGLFKIESVDNDGERASLVGVKTAKWERGVLFGYDPNEVRKAWILPFECAEPTGGPDAVAGTSEPALVRVYIYLIDGLSVTPPTYMQPDAGARPVGEPYGGAMLEGAEFAGNQVDGPFPLYLVGLDVLGDLAKVLNRMLVPAGYRVEFMRIELDLGTWP